VTYVTDAISALIWFINPLGDHWATCPSLYLAHIIGQLDRVAAVYCTTSSHW